MQLRWVECCFRFEEAGWRRAGVSLWSTFSAQSPNEEGPNVQGKETRWPIISNWNKTLLISDYLCCYSISNVYPIYTYICSMYGMLKNHMKANIPYMERGERGLGRPFGPWARSWWANWSVDHLFKRKNKTYKKGKKNDKSVQDPEVGSRSLDFQGGVLLMNSWRSLGLCLGFLKLIGVMHIIGLLLPLPLPLFALVLILALLTGVTRTPPVPFAFGFSIGHFHHIFWERVSCPQGAPVRPSSTFLARFGWAAGEDPNTVQSVRGWLSFVQSQIWKVQYGWVTCRHSFLGISHPLFTAVCWPVISMLTKDCMIQPSFN